MADTIQTASKKIQTKHSNLKKGGFDLVAITSPVRDVAFGGFFQDFQKGRIYSHHAIGTFEVHGGILAKYKSRGEFSRSPFIRRRELGLRNLMKNVLLNDSQRVFLNGVKLYICHIQMVECLLAAQYIMTGEPQQNLKLMDKNRLINNYSYNNRK